VFAWTTEFWNPFTTAGIEDYKFIEWGIDHPFDDDLKLLAYSDEQLGGEGFVDWYEYDHPQLGPVELGGWHTAHWIRNPPLHLLEAEVAPHADWAIWHVLVAPSLALHSVTAEAIGDAGDTWLVRLVVHNTGWLPTNVTQKAVERKAVKPLVAELLADDGVELVGTDRRHELGQLPGRVGKNSMLGGFGAATDGTAERAKAEWVVRAPAGTDVRVEARHDRAGVVRASVVLGG
jgi:hypothetical protein